MFLCLNPCFHGEINIISDNSKIKHNLKVSNKSVGGVTEKTLQILLKSHFFLYYTLIKKQINITITKKKWNQRVFIRLACFMLNRI